VFKSSHQIYPKNRNYKQPASHFSDYFFVVVVVIPVFLSRFEIFGHGDN